MNYLKCPVPDCEKIALGYNDEDPPKLKCENGHTWRPFNLIEENPLTPPNPEVSQAFSNAFQSAIATDPDSIEVMPETLTKCKLDGYMINGNLPGLRCTDCGLVVVLQSTQSAPDMPEGCPKRVG